jgi:hypothetical protein
MSKKNRQSRKRKRLEMARKSKIKPVTIAILTGLITIVGGISAALALLPRMTVEVSEPADRYNIFSSSFTITNTNFIPLEHVTAMLALGHIDYGNNRMHISGSKSPEVNPEFSSPLFTDGWNDHRLSMDEKFAITLSDILDSGFGRDLTGADIAILVRYKPWIIPWQRQKLFRFKAHKQSDGQFTWYPATVDR